MKMNPMRVTMLALLPAVLLSLSSCSSPSHPPPVGKSTRTAFEKGVPGGVLLQTVEVSAVVTAIDQARRKATLRASDGRKFTVKVASEAVNFEQVSVGDRINATVTERVVVSLDSNGADSADSAAAVVTRAPEGAQPGAFAAETMVVTTRVTAIDFEKRLVTFQSEDGTTDTFPVRADVDLSRHQVGEHLIFRVTEMIAIWVEKL